MINLTFIFQCIQNTHCVFSVNFNCLNNYSFIKAIPPFRDLSVLFFLCIFKNHILMLNHTHTLSFIVPCSNHFCIVKKRRSWILLNEFSLRIRHICCFYHCSMSVLNAKIKVVTEKNTNWDIPHRFMWKREYDYKVFLEQEVCKGKYWKDIYWFTDLEKSYRWKI